ncbi:MAG: hypothetical protein ABI869_06290 [Actinomycetota bacterium]
MPIDARLRDGLERSMSTIDTDVEPFLHDARRRGHRRLLIRRVATVIAVAAAIVIVAVAGPGLRDLLRGREQQPAVPPPPVQISGTYTTTISKSGLTGSGAGAAGTWLLILDRSGTLDLASLTNGNVGRSVTQYQATQNGFLTTALADGSCTGLGTYTWSRSGSVLTFSVVSDPCPLRVAIFSSQPWRLQ